MVLGGGVVVGEAWVAVFVTLVGWKGVVEVEVIVGWGVVGVEGAGWVGRFVDSGMWSVTVVG